jgi:heme oxygenase
MRTEMAARACLRQATREHHEQLQALPFFRSLAAATMDAASYLDFLKVMVIVHEAVDEAARGLLWGFAIELWDERSSRRAAFAADIASLEASGTRQRAVNAQVHSLALGEEVMALAEAGDTMALLGALYVLRGLALGAPVLRAQIERCCQNGLDLPTGALSFNAREVHAEWERFGDALDVAD